MADFLVRAAVRATACIALLLVAGAFGPAAARHGARPGPRAGPVRRGGGGERGSLPGPGAARRPQLSQRRRRRDGAVEGGVAFDAQGRVLPGDSRFTIDLRTLRSDEARRDNYVRRNTLETDRYPTVTFVPTEARRLPVPLPPSGSVPFELVGDLTVKDVTRRVTWDATATFDGPQVTIRARTAFRFGDFGLPRPARVGGAQRGGRHQARGGSRAPAELVTRPARRPAPRA